ncbi:hypothetical protein F2P56_035612 [Juglans regia]|uniref:BAHD acyltransferase At5g47980-like n=2 Tax=Juglans regia TaxID=51240 RepID=A0A833T4Y3_JUGRE|nr:BAHD acyltransferase At5g47980-like [Juglans regia]KAF5443015.1 hypothetical protein F2P56_035612 [Juglans regia]
MEIKVEIINREVIKPSPTPHHLRCFDLCLLDQLQPKVFIPLVLFYSNNSTVNPSDLPHFKAADISHRLKTSLAETLSRFYPLAGRVKDNVSIECNDAGVDYLEARVNCRQSDILERPEQKTLYHFFPKEIVSPQPSTERLVLVQVTFFDCGGMAIGVCVSHMLADAATTCMFIHSWAGAALAARASDMAVLLPEFSAASRIPPRIEFNIRSPSRGLVNRTTVTRRYVFHASNIAALKAKAASTKVPQPTRIEVVSSLIWKCAIKASRSNHRSLMPSMLTQMMNIREKLVPPFPKNAFGNLVCTFGAQTTESEIQLHDLVIELRKRKEAICEDYATKLYGDEAFSIISEKFKQLGNLLASKDIHHIFFSSWCRNPLYEYADFGWGRPTWVTVATMVLNNPIVLMDTRDGSGIEAWITLSEEDMALFEHDKELLEFASFNPSVLN